MEVENLLQVGTAHGTLSGARLVEWAEKNRSLLDQYSVRLFYPRGIAGLAPEIGASSADLADALEFYERTRFVVDTGEETVTGRVLSVGNLATAKYPDGLVIVIHSEIFEALCKSN